MKKTVILVIIGLNLSTQLKSQTKPMSKNKNEESHVCEIIKTDKEWKAQLTPEQYKILIQKGTEMPFTGAYYNNKETGMYTCAACGTELFSSNTKFDSGTGWPSFWQVVSSESVLLKEDRTHGMVRTEVMCKKCGGHLGHVFDDGPKPTGLRFCINSASLNFVPKK